MLTARGSVGAPMVPGRGPGAENAVSVLLEPSTWWLRNRSAAGRILAMELAAKEEGLHGADAGDRAGAPGSRSSSFSSSSSSFSAAAKEGEDGFSVARLMALAEDSGSESGEESEWGEGESDLGEPEPSLADLMGGGADGDEPAFAEAPEGSEVRGADPGQQEGLEGWKERGLTMERLLELERDRSLVREAMDPEFFRRRPGHQGWSTMAGLGLGLSGAGQEQAGSAGGGRGEEWGP